MCLEAVIFMILCAKKNNEHRFTLCTVIEEYLGEIS